jgi:hypothetical protein
VLRTGADHDVTRRPLHPNETPQEGFAMTTPTPIAVTCEVQLARSVLAELAENGVRLLSRDRHLDVLLALDNLELAARGAWPPPDAARGITDVQQALTRARDALAAVLVDLRKHDVDPIHAALAHDHVVKALTRLP